MNDHQWFIDRAEHGMDITTFGVYKRDGLGYKLDSVHDNIEDARNRADQLNGEGK